MAVTGSDGVSAPRTIFKGSNPYRWLQAVLRPSSSISDQAEAAIADREGLGVVLRQPLLPMPLGYCRDLVCR